MEKLFNIYGKNINILYNNLWQMMINQIQHTSYLIITIIIKRYSYKDNIKRGFKKPKTFWFQNLLTN